MDQRKSNLSILRFRHGGYKQLEQKKYMKKWGDLFSFHVFFLKCKSIKAIYIYASERSRYTLSENCVIYCAITYCSEEFC